MTKHVHVFDDSPGYGVHCVKCGFKPKQKSYIANVKRFGRGRK